jgi:hypothetical protein
MELFLNFDGVLHPSSVSHSQNGTPVLDAPGHQLFESTNALATVAADFPNLSLRLNTWWTYSSRLEECLERLPKSLSLRVVGSILPHASLCTAFPNRITMATNAADASEVPVLILDHADARYPKHLLRAAFLVAPDAGLASPLAIRAFHRFLTRAHREQPTVQRNE